MSSPELSSSADPAEPVEEHVACKVDEGFAAWMQASGGSLMISTYQAGKVVMVGWNGRQVSILPRHFPRPMGIAIPPDQEDKPSQIALATREELLLFADAPLLAHDYVEPGLYDALFLPRVAYYTGRLNLHDLAFGGETLWMVNTRFSCLCTLSAQYNFVPQWKPWFITELAPEDRCHLNGMTLVDGQPRFVTALGMTDTARGWTENKAFGGVLIDIVQNETLRVGLAMPHSPRYRNGQIFLLNSGMGEFCVVDPLRKDYTAICALPGYLRGLCLVGNYALLGMSKIREAHTFGGLPLQQRFQTLMSGVSIIDLTTGQCCGTLEFLDGCHELYDVQFLPGLRRPSILNRQKVASRRAYTSPEFSYWMETPTTDEVADRAGT